MGSSGENLVFLISQPRAGSTLLQRILCSHPEIHTTSEPWLMLHALYATRPGGSRAEYDARVANRALMAFIETLPDGQDDYIEGLRRMCAYLYGRALSGSGKRRFLDKTPRYYLVIPELRRVFPMARYIILFRKPPAVLCSILDKWVRGNWFQLRKYRHDLIRAPRLLVEGVKTLGNQATVVRYESLVQDPEREVKRVCSELGLDFMPGMIEYGRHDHPWWGLGDKEEIYKHAHPVPENAEKWVGALDDPQVWRLVNDYLHLLGQQAVEAMGYHWEETRRVLEAHKPGRLHLWLTFTLSQLLGKPDERKTRRCALTRLTKSLLRRALRKRD